MDAKLNPLFEHSLAEFASCKVQGAKRMLEHSGSLVDAWYYELLHLNPSAHVPESVREDFAFLTKFMHETLEAAPGGDLRFKAGTSREDLQLVTSAFWRIYDAVQFWYGRLTDSAATEETPSRLQ